VRVIFFLGPIRDHGLVAAEIQEHGGAGGRGVFPELLKIFKEIGPDGLEVVAE
jgi:hypothetical protein